MTLSKSYVLGKHCGHHIPPSLDTICMLNFQEIKCSHKADRNLLKIRQLLTGRAGIQTQGVKYKSLHFKYLNNFVSNILKIFQLSFINMRVTIENSVKAGDKGSSSKLTVLSVQLLISKIWIIVMMAPIKLTQNRQLHFVWAHHQIPPPPSFLLKKYINCF